MRAVTLVLALGVAVLGFAMLGTSAQQSDLTQLPSTGGGGGSDDGGLVGADPVELVSEPSFAVGVAVGAAALGLAGWFAFRGGAKFVTRENVLENDTRYDLYEFLRQNPGMHLRAIAESLELSTTNVLWHLRKLEDADLVRGKKLEGYKVFYPVEGGMEGKRHAMASAVLRNDNAQTILEYIAANPGAHQREMARAIGVNHGTVRWHLRKMVNTDLLLQVKREHAIQYYLTDLGAAVLGEGLPTEPVPAGEGETAASA